MLEDTALRADHTGKKVVYLDKFSIIIQRAASVAGLSRLDKFGRRGKIFRRTTDKICPG